MEFAIVRPSTYIVQFLSSGSILTPFERLMGPVSYQATIQMTLRLYILR